MRTKFCLFVRLPGEKYQKTAQRISSASGKSPVFYGLYTEFSGFATAWPQFCVFLPCLRFRSCVVQGIFFRCYEYKGTIMRAIKWMGSLLMLVSFATSSLQAAERTEMRRLKTEIKSAFSPRMPQSLQTYIQSAESDFVAGSVKAQITCVATLTYVIGLEVYNTCCGGSDMAIARLGYLPG